MTDRLTLTATLATLPDIDPDAALAFVTQEKIAGGRGPAERVDPDRSRPAVTEPTRKPVKRSKPSRITPVGLIPVTVRLRPEVAGGLKRASLERELAGEETFTQQDLVERLLEPWLRKNGFLA